MKWEWDVKSAMPYTMKMKTINFMAYMLNNIPYAFLMNAPLETVVRRIVMNAEKLPDRLNRGARSRGHKIQPKMMAQFAKVQNIVPVGTVSKGITLREFYEKPNTQLDKDRKDILVHLRDFHTPQQITFPDGTTKMVNEFAHFCTPFLSIQAASEAGDNSRLVPVATLTEFLALVGHFTILDLYTRAHKNCTPEEIQGIALGYNAGILEFTTTPISGGAAVTPLTPPAGNGMQCEYGECVDGSPNDWCTEDEDGNCTAGS